MGSAGYSRAKAWTTFLDVYMKESDGGSPVDRGVLTRGMCKQMKIAGGASYSALAYFENSHLVEMDDGHVKLNPVIYEDMKNFRMYRRLASATIRAKIMRDKKATLSS